MPEREQEQIDRLLRDAMSGPTPKLSPDFEAQLARRMRPPGLTTGARWALILYAAIAVFVTIWATKDVPQLGPWIEQWAVPAAALALVPLSFVWTLRRLERSARIPR